MTDGESLRETYKNTLLTIQLPDGSTYQTSNLTHSESEWPFDDEKVHVITAWNPKSRPLEKLENESRNRELETALENRGLSHLPCRGHAGDNSWHEDGYAIRGLTTVEAIGIGANFEQNAIFELNRFQISVVDCLDY